MPLLKLAGNALIFCGLLCASTASHAMSYYKQNGVLKIWGDADQSDIAKLKAQLTSDVQTIILRPHSKGSWSIARDLANLVEKAGVTTVAQGACENFVCPMLFLSGKQRMFSTSMRPEVSFIGLTISSEHFPEGAGDDSRRPWLDVTTWWREHTKLGHSEVWPRHQAFIRPTGILKVENLRFFHPSARTSKGSAIECFGEDQSFPKCVAMTDGQDALKAGIITTLDRYVPQDKSDILEDIATPLPTAFARLDESPLRVSKLNDSCNSAYEKFVLLDSPRAFVVSSGGGCFLASAQTATPYKTAMGNCRKWADLVAGRSCRFYAVDSQVVFTEFASPEPAVPSQ